MNREEEIIRSIPEGYDDIDALMYLRGALWADEHPSSETIQKFLQDNNKDVFIEKACKLLVDCIEDFMASRMEIWNEESKKQTLENLRKTLKK